MSHDGIQAVNPSGTNTLPRAIIDQIESLPCWAELGALKLDIAALAGGITNHNLLVTATGAPDGKSAAQARYVVRLGDDIPVHHIQRVNEVAISQAAHAAGLSPAIRHAGKGVLVMDFIESRTLSAEQIREQSMLERLVPLIKRCHLEIPDHLRGAPVVFWVFHVIRDYAVSLKEGGSGHSSKLPPLLEASAQLQQAAGPFDIVFGHNDLLAANFLDDGQRLWLIDWEYGGFNTPLFDLGGLASNNELTESQEKWMLENYFEQSLQSDRWRSYQAMKCASLLRETLWSMISEIHSTLDFDYAAYSTENLQAFEKSYEEFRQL